MIPSRSTTINGSTSCGIPMPLTSPTHATTRIETPYAIPAAQQRDEWGPHRAEGERQQDGDEHDAGELDVGERGVDLVELRQACGYRSGHPDERVVGPPARARSLARSV